MKLPERARRPLIYIGLGLAACVGGAALQHLRIQGAEDPFENQLGSGTVGVGSNFRYSPEGTRIYDRQWYDQASGNKLTQEHVVETCVGTTLVSTAHPIDATAPPLTTYYENSVFCADFQLTPDDFDGGLPPGYTPQPESPSDYTGPHG